MFSIFKYSYFSSLKEPKDVLKLATAGDRKLLGNLKYKFLQPAGSGHLDLEEGFKKAEPKDRLSFLRGSLDTF